MDSIGYKCLEKMRGKYKQGMLEHNGGLSEAPEDLVMWIKHLQEEAMDTVAYCEKILATLRGQQ